jgi:hypothetical protein
VAQQPRNVCQALRELLRQRAFAGHNLADALRLRHAQRTLDVRHAQVLAQLAVFGEQVAAPALVAFEVGGVGAVVSQGAAMPGTASSLVRIMPPRPW